MGQDAAHDHRRHDAARRRDERHVPEAIGTPPAEERVAGEEVDGVALAEHQAGGIAEALAQVERGRDHFVIASQRNAPPFSFAGKDGEPQGILVEFWRLWAARNGHEITFYLDDLDETIEAVRKGKADFHSGLFYSDPRSAYLDFSSGFLDDTLSLFVLDRLNVQSVSDLAATPVVVGVSRDHYAAEYMQYNHPLLRLKLYPNSEDVVMSALRSEIVAFAVDYPVAFYFLSKHDARGQFRVVTDLATHELRAAFRKGNRETLDVVEAGLGKIGKDELARLSDKWGLREKRLFPPWLVKALVGGGAGLLFLALLVNWYLLRREVRRQTRELNEKNRILNLINRDMLAASQTVQGQIEALEKMGRDKDEILRIVAEGLRTPIQGIAEITKSGSSDTDQEVHGQTEKMIRLIDRLMEVSRLETESYSQELSKTDLAKLLEVKRKEFRQMAEMKGLAFEMTLPKEPLWVFVHPRHFGEICDNLITGISAAASPVIRRHLPDCSRAAACQRGQAKFASTRKNVSIASSYFSWWISVSPISQAAIAAVSVWPPAGDCSTRR
jgi:ABC-type amino acid transport substrate-binding protein